MPAPANLPAWTVVAVEAGRLARDSWKSPTTCTVPAPVCPVPVCPEPVCPAPPACQAADIPAEPARLWWGPSAVGGLVGAALTHAAHVGLRWAAPRRHGPAPVRRGGGVVA